VGVEIVIVLLLTLLNGVFSAAEIAVLSVRKTRLAELVAEGSRGARATQWLREQPERFLATVQIGITVLSTTAAAFGGDSLADDLAAWMAPRAPWLGGAHRLALVLVISLLSYLSIVLGELVPKSLALRNAERLALLLSPLLRGISSVARPLVWLFTASSNALLRLFGDHTSFVEARLSAEELQELVEEAGRTGSLDPGASEIASRAIDFRELTAFDVMVPRECIVSVSQSTELASLAETLPARRFARLPVYAEHPDNIVGYVALKDLLAPTIQRQGGWRDCVRAVRFVPTSMPATALLRSMQSERLPMVMVTDESGSLRGLVTVEDLVEELVGEILSEGDPAPVRLTRDADGGALLPGNTPIRDANRALGLDLDEPDGIATLAGLCIAAAGHLPRVGERVTLAGGHVLEVIDATTRRVRLLRLRPRDRGSGEERNDRDALGGA
jgi:putative hemolysin